jgi:prolyl-tRNA editing enzyme YbaK/EbsC (Cys-tRNA(Pro) deacylase)
MNNIVTNLHPSVLEGLARCDIAYKVFDCDPDFADTAVFCEKYGYKTSQSANAIIAATKSEPVKYACCIVLATHKVDVNKKVSQLLGTKKVSFASGEQTIQLTGMQIGGVTPFGLPDIPIFIDEAVFDNEEVVLGGGNRATKVLLNPHELKKLPGSQIIPGLGLPK